MRITIEIDNQGAATAVATSTPDGVPTEADVLDGGAFGGTSAASAVDIAAGGAVDAGAPPESLVAEIAAAAAITSADGTAGDEDAGPGPA